MLPKYSRIDLVVVTRSHQILDPLTTFHLLTVINVLLSEMRDAGWHSVPFSPYKNDPQTPVRWSTILSSSLSLILTDFQLFLCVVFFAPFHRSHSLINNSFQLHISTVIHNAFHNAHRSRSFRRNDPRHAYECPRQPTCQFAEPT